MSKVNYHEIWMAETRKYTIILYFGKNRMSDRLIFPQTNKIPLTFHGNFPTDMNSLWWRLLRTQESNSLWNVHWDLMNCICSWMSFMSWSNLKNTMYFWSWYWITEIHYSSFHACTLGLWLDAGKDLSLLIFIISSILFLFPWKVGRVV